MKVEFSRQIIEKQRKISNFMKIRPLGAELFHAGRQKEGRTVLKEMIVVFRNFACVPKKETVISH